MASSNQDSSDDFLNRSLQRLRLRAPSRQLDARLTDLFQVAEHSVKPPRLIVAPVVTTGYWYQGGLALTCILIGVVIGRLSVVDRVDDFAKQDQEQILRIVGNQAVPDDVSPNDTIEHRSKPSQVDSSPLGSDSERKTDDAFIASNPPQLGESSVPRVVSEQLLIIDGVPVRKVHMVSAQEIKTYNKTQQRYVTKLLPKSQFVFTPAPGA